MLDRSEQLLANFNYYRDKTMHTHNMKREHPVRPRSMTKANHKILLSMQKWCLDRQIDAMLWMFALFKLRGWRAAPSFKASHLESENLIPRYRKMKGIGFYSAHLTSTRAKKAEEERHDPNRDLAPTIEAEKRRILASDDPRRCLDEILIRTMGFHPKSAVCRSCQFAPECAVRIQSCVPFSILGLRAGTVTQAEAKQAAALAVTSDDDDG